MHQLDHSAAAAHASSSRTPAMPRISTALAFPPSSTSSPDTAGSASLASPATSTPRATSPDNHSSELMSMPAGMAGLALQVQSAVSRNVTGPLVQVLTDAQEASALHRAQHDTLRTHSAEASASSSSSSSSSRTAPMPAHASTGSKYVSALSSPDLVPCDVAAQSSAQALMGTGAQEPDDLLHAADVDADATAQASPSPIVAPLLQQRDSGSSDGSGSGTEASLAQSDICRTPSTSTTGSSHAGSLDTAISSVPSGTEFESNYKSHVEEQSADTLRVNVAAYDPTIAPSQASPISLNSEADNALLDYSPLAHDASPDASLIEAKFTTAKVRRYAALLELIDTERNYADDLATLVLVFFDNLCMMPFFNDQPARQALVMRNSEDLLRTHQKLSAKLDAILVDLGLRKSGQRHADDQKTELEKALSPQADEAVVRAAKLFNQMMPSLQSYKAFCSRHGEALALIREAEKRHADWDAFERHCADILRLTQRAHRHHSSRPPSGATTPSVWATNSPASYFTPIASSSPATPSPNLASGSTSTLTAINASGSNPGSAAVTPGTAPSVMRQNSSRLLFRDFLIKPIQRLCLYPLVLQTLQKHSSATGDSVDELALAISLMREVADQVDEAGKRRESELRADLISSRIEPNQGVTLSFLKSLGDCQLSGTLDVLHHHRLLNPLTAPLRFKYFGVFVYHSFLLMVKVRKNSTYECRHWFPLWAARLSNIEDEQNLIPNSFRLSVRDHHFELAASNAKERQLWIDMLSLAISRATFSPPGSEAAFPCSLFFGDAPDGESLEASEAPTPNASRPAEFQGYFETAKAGTVDPLMEFLAMHAAGAAHATGTNNRGQRASSSGPWMPTEILLRHASSNSRAIVDRGMVLSDAVISARIARDGGALSTLYAASGSGIGSAVGSSLGLSRLSAKDTATVKIQRRKSCAGLLENADAEDDPNNLVFTATLVQPGSRSRASTRAQLDAVSEREGWKSSLLKKANRVRPASIFAPTGLSVNTDGLASPVWGPGSVSTPSSPIAAGRDLLVHEFGSFGITGSVPLSPTTPTSHVAGIGGAELASHSLTSSPNSGCNSAANSTVNLRAQGYAMPTRSRTSLYSMKDSLTMTFGKRVRTRSVQGGVGEADPMHDFGAGSALSSAAASPMASNVSLPHGEVVDSNSRRPSADELYRGQKARSRTNSISSVTGSIRRVFTSASLASLSHKRVQSDAAKLGGSVQAERQLAGTTVEEEPRKTGAGTLRRSRTMLDYSRSWFRGSATSVVERVNAQAVAPATSPDQEQVPRVAGAKGDAIRRASDTHVGRIDQQPRGARQSSRVYNKLKFLSNNKLSPLQ